MNILITGSAGFIGSNCVDFLLDRGLTVTGIDDLSYGKECNINKKSIFYHLDVRDYHKLAEIIISEKPSHIIHFAADATTRSSALGWNDPMKDYSINILGTLNILEILRQEKLDSHLIYASSAAVYGEPNETPIKETHPTFPVSPYGISKLAGEKYCYAYFKEYQIKTTVIRIFNTYGPRQSRYVIYDQIKNIMNNPNEINILGTGTQLRDYIYVSDTVEAFYSAMTNISSVGEIFNVAGGEYISIKNLIKILKDILKKEPIENYTGKSWKGDISKLWGDTDKITNQLGWKPKIQLKDGIQKFVEWMRENEEI